MPRFAANLTMMFNEWAFLDRFDAAAEAGFKAVEFLFPYAFSPDQLAERLRRNALEVALFNGPPGDWAAGERGVAVFPGRAAEFDASIEKALDYALALNARRVHVMAGIAPASDKTAAAQYRRSIAHAGDAFRPHGIAVSLEPLNARSTPGYFLNDFSIAEKLIEELGADNVTLQFDVFHRQILHGDVTEAFRRMLHIIGHVQIASVPSRHEPDGEEINYPFLFAEFDRLGYKGFVGCEYNPKAGTLPGLGWFNTYKGA